MTHLTDTGITISSIIPAVFFTLCFAFFTFCCSSVAAPVDVKLAGRFLDWVFLVPPPVPTVCRFLPLTLELLALLLGTELSTLKTPLASAHDCSLVFFRLFATGDILVLLLPDPLRLSSILSSSPDTGGGGGVDGFLLTVFLFFT
ncbi:hypothetical protein SGHV100 [Glossina pallidipes salivary gland hypertrophy virus]|uniref:Uncharacterized protein n=1 Tax=Glossina hytrovirus (isolate Glossina pallidipes/Ethiopia/Seibersdorf/-) TaxID=379529 RepID=B0YLQ4_GHVS|nr:hypothetical protein SGHV100 [Glossina pallidipes salivary gland hypertrophy virus]ABQ08873.1 hypothetical protein SGHV100 [Glossina pallidipes salivary gland hypertrophy virus]